jgi:lipoprotein signal peptidase
MFDIFYYPLIRDYTNTKHNPATYNLADNYRSVIIDPLLR